MWKGMVIPMPIAPPIDQPEPRRLPCKPVAENERLKKKRDMLLETLHGIQKMAEHDLQENYCSGYMHQIEADARDAIAAVEANQ
jgi:hypothetical protein